MTFEEYNQKIISIHTELQQIADRTAQQALVGSAEPSNPMFATLMQRHEQLIKLTSELNERMIERMKIQ